MRNLKLIFSLLILVSLFMTWRQFWWEGSSREVVRPADDLIAKAVGSATTGNLFTGNKIREFPANRRRYWTGYSRQRNCDEDRGVKTGRFDSCGSKWAVVTTIFSPPSEAVRRFLYATDWCVVVVGDKGAPQDYYFDSTLGDNIIFLSDSTQSQIGGNLIDFLPWKNFGRKNVGFLFAVARGAKFIWDFDDDNSLKFWMDGATPDPTLSIGTYLKDPGSYGIVEPDHDNQTVAFNPYPILGGPHFPTWPRGFPLDLILKNSTWNRPLKPVNQESVKFGVLQSLADIQPDFDAIYRLTKKTPVVFDRPSKAKAPPYQDSNYTFRPKPVVRVPHRLISPYNAQATLHFYDAFWALFLPVTVHGRVSDIWRSYAAQALFPDVGLSLGFLPRPLVVQDRNPHSYLADFEAETQLYRQSRVLVDHVVRNYVRKARNDVDDDRDFLDKLESLWIDLYERGFVEIDDVYLVQLWIESLLSVGYRFPDYEVFSCLGFSSDLKERIVSSGETLKKIASVALETKLSKSIHFPRDLSFATVDMHQGSRTHVTATLSTFGINVTIMGFHGRLKNYPQVNDWPGVSFITELSPVFQVYVKDTILQEPHWVEENYNFYKDDERVKKIDAFFCSFPPSVCQLWVPFDRPVIIVSAHRYNLAQCTVEMWNSFNGQLRIWSREKRSSVGVTNRYDLEYMKYYTGIDPLLVPTFGAYHLNHIESRETHDSLLIFTFKFYKSEFSKNVESYLNPEIKTRYVKNSHDTREFNIEELAKYRAAVYIPYSVFSLRITELYAVGVPLFMPSPKFLLNHSFVEPLTGKMTVGLGHDRTMVSVPYCVNTPGLETATRPRVEDGLSSHPYSPNVDMDEDAEAEMYWMQFSDWYEMPHVRIFDDLRHLKKLLLEADFAQIRRDMKDELRVKEFLGREKWSEMTRKVWESKGKGK